MAFNFLKSNLLGIEAQQTVRSVQQQKQMYLDYKKNKSTIKDAYLERKNLVLNQIFEYAENKHKQLLEHNNLMEIVQGKFDIRNQKIRQTHQQMVQFYSMNIKRLEQQIVKVNSYSQNSNNKYLDEIRVIDQLNLVEQLQENENERIRSRIEFIENDVIDGCLLENISSLDKELESVKNSLMQVKVQVQKIEFQSCYELQQVSNHVMNKKDNDDFLQKVLKYMRISEKVYQIQMDAAQYTIQFIKTSCQRMKQILDNIERSIRKYVMDNRDDKQTIEKILQLQKQQEQQQQNINEFDVCQILDDSDIKMIQKMMDNGTSGISLQQVSELLVGLQKIQMDVHYQSLIRNKYQVKLGWKGKERNVEVYLSIDGFLVIYDKEEGQDIEVERKVPIKVLECKKQNMKVNEKCLEIKNEKMTMEFKNKDLVEEIVHVINML